MHELQQVLAERISMGLKNKSITTCSRWALNRRILGPPRPGPWTFKWHPWLREMHDSDATLNVGQKSAQMGYTETALNITFFLMDIKGWDVLYVLPATTPDASDFSAARFNGALDLSPHLKAMFHGTQNVGHKKSGTTNLYVRGSRSRAGLKSVPVAGLILDELDEMTQDNIPLAFERMSGQPEHIAWMISTPTVDNYGINKYFNKSTQEYFYFKCPHCSRHTNLQYPESIVITAEKYDDPKIRDTHLICKECKGKLEHQAKTEWLAKGQWVPTHTDRDSRGFHISQLYSTTVSPVELAQAFISSQRDKSDEQEFYNSKLGIPHIVEGARLTDKDIDECTGDYLTTGGLSSGFVTMGVDVGKFLHYEIDIWRIPPNESTISTDLNVKSRAKVVAFGKAKDFTELDLLIAKYRVAFTVVDRNPETRAALEFAYRHPGHVRLCFYPNGIAGRQIILSQEEPSLSVDRTSWLDLSLGRFKNRTITVPRNIDDEYRGHIKAPCRVYDKDRNGNPVGKYVSTEEDHYAHARLYSEVALPLAASLGVSQTITGRIL